MDTHTSTTSQERETRRDFSSEWIDDPQEIQDINDELVEMAEFRLATADRPSVFLSLMGKKRKELFGYATVAKANLSTKPELAMINFQAQLMLSTERDLLQERKDLLKGARTSEVAEIKRIKEGDIKDKFALMKTFSDFQKKHDPIKADIAYGAIINAAMNDIMPKQVDSLDKALHGKKFKNPKEKDKYIEKQITEIERLANRAVETGTTSYFKEGFFNTENRAKIAKIMEGNSRYSKKFKDLESAITERMALGERAEKLFIKEQDYNKKIARYTLDLPVAEGIAYQEKNIKPLKSEYLSKVYGALSGLRSRFNPERMKEYEEALDALENYLAAIDEKVFEGIRMEQAIKDEFKRLKKIHDQLNEKFLEFEDLAASFSGDEELDNYLERYVEPFFEGYHDNIDTIVEEIGENYRPERHQQYLEALQTYEEMLNKVNREIVEKFFKEREPRLKLLKEARTETGKAIKQRLESGETDFERGDVIDWQIGNKPVQIEFLGIRPEAKREGIIKKYYQFRIISFNDQELEDGRWTRLEQDLDEDPVEFRKLLGERKKLIISRIEKIPFAKASDDVKGKTGEIDNDFINLLDAVRGEEIRKLGNELKEKLDFLEEYLGLLNRMSEAGSKDRGLKKGDLKRLEKVDIIIREFRKNPELKDNKGIPVILDEIQKLRQDFLYAPENKRPDYMKKLVYYQDFLEKIKAATKEKLIEEAREWYARYASFHEDYGPVSREDQIEARSESGYSGEDRKRMKEMVDDNLKDRHKGKYSQALPRFVANLIILERRYIHDVETADIESPDKPEAESVPPRLSIPPLSSEPALEVVVPVEIEEEPEPEPSASAEAPADREPEEEMTSMKLTENTLIEIDKLNRNEIFNDNEGVKFLTNYTNKLATENLFSSGERAEKLRDMLEEMLDLMEVLNNPTSIEEVRKMAIEWSKAFTDIMAAGTGGGMMKARLDSAHKFGFKPEMRTIFNELSKGKPTEEKMDEYLNVLANFAAMTMDLEDKVQVLIDEKERATIEDDRDTVEEARTIEDEPTQELDIDIEPHDFGANKSEMMDYFNITAKKGDMVRAVGLNGLDFGDVYFWGKDGHDFLLTSKHENTDLSKKDLINSGNFLKADERWDLRPYFELTQEELERQMEDVEDSLDDEEEPESIEEIINLADRAIENGTLTNFLADKENWSEVVGKELSYLPGAKIEGVRQDPDGSVWVEIDAGGVKFSEAVEDIDFQIKS
ncbi:hypothetical protein KKC88_00610 [Patescibacteria group bacterium]|nr:hypothetical protein [Patescibacteria group bacterium]MBU1673785.1 hypothetical protein [Patescibacteria group bacterium]MBU1964125.1 hypothetical protein [Patescibacteria group bacterium]